MNMISKRTLFLILSMAVMAGCSSTDTKESGDDSSTQAVDTGSVTSTEMSAEERERKLEQKRRGCSA